MGRRQRGITMQVEGLDQLRERMHELPDEIRAGATAALHEAAEAIESDMRDGVPVDTGTLQESITARVTEADLRADVGPMGQDAYYGAFVEHGTSSQAAQPFAGPAGEAERGRFPDRLREHVGDHIQTS